MTKFNHFSHISQIRQLHVSTKPSHYHQVEHAFPKYIKGYTYHSPNSPYSQLQKYDFVLVASQLK